MTGLEYVLLDWEGVFREGQDGESIPVEFNKKFIKTLGDDVRTEIVRLSFEGGLPEMGIEAEKDDWTEGEQKPEDPI